MLPEGYAMATQAIVPVAEYLRTRYRPDCDYVDGEIRERNLGERDHGDLQTRIAFLLCMPDNARHVYAIAELRVQVKAERYRVPDVCVLARKSPREQIVRTPPLLCIEVLSPEDTMQRMRERVRDYLDMGVREVWVVNAESRSVMIFAGMGMVEHSAGEITVPETPVALAIADIFKVLDEY
jgi:Uma2 family endonuclease